MTHCGNAGAFRGGCPRVIAHDSIQPIPFLSNVVVRHAVGRIAYRLVLFEGDRTAGWQTKERKRFKFVAKPHASDAYRTHALSDAYFVPGS